MNISCYLGFMEAGKISERAVNEFWEIYFKEFKKELTFEEAAEKAWQLIRFYEVILLPTEH